MIEKLDYKKYLSVDNGKGLLLSGCDTFVLDQYSIDYYKFSNMKDLILIVSKFIDEHYDEDLEDLEEVLEHLLETHYYTEVNK
ncbi:MAG: hypothetical protein IJ509_00250 [Bacilli bacterium]|nr:hypothetical protein [Bacilli bacterium]